MAGTTIKEFTSKLAESTNATFKKNNPQIFGSGGGNALTRVESSVQQGDSRGQPVRKEHLGPANNATATSKSPEEKLNKLERRWLAVLRTRYPAPGIQNITLRLSDDLRYTPDLNSNESPLVFFETKGLHRFREKGILKLKWAANLYPFFDFYLVTWDKDIGWSETLMPKR